MLMVNSLKMKDVGLFARLEDRTLVLRIGSLVCRCLNWAARHNGRWAKSGSRNAGDERCQSAN